MLAQLWQEEVCELHGGQHIEFHEVLQEVERKIFYLSGIAHARIVAEVADADAFFLTKIEYFLGRGILGKVGGDCPDSNAVFLS